MIATQPWQADPRPAGRRRAASGRGRAGGPDGAAATGTGGAGDRGSGRIVLISSLGGVLGIPFQAFYSASKFALEGLAESLAYEVAPFGIEVTLVQPGNIKTGFTAARKMAAAAEDDEVYGAALKKA